VAELDPASALELLEGLVVPTLAIGADGRVRWANAASERLLAWPRELLDGQPLDSLFPRRYRAKSGEPLYRYFLEHAKSAPERSFGMSCLRRDGVEIEVDCSVSLIGGALTLTLMRRPESFGGALVQEGIESEQRYRLVFDHAPLALWHFDARGVITACNEPFVRVMGSSKRALIGLNQLTLQDSFVVDCVRGALAGQRMHYEGDYRSATGGKVTPVRADFASIRSEDGTITGGVGIMEDITERKRAEDAMRASNATLRAVFEASPLPIISLHPDGRVRMWNPAAEAVFGWPAAEVVGQPVPGIPAERSKEFFERFRQILEGEVLLNFETYYKNKEGQDVDVSVSSAPLVVREGEVAGTITVLADITERKRASLERTHLLENERAARQAAESAQLRLELLAEASTVIASSLDYKDTVQRTARMALPRFAQRAAVVLLDVTGLEGVKEGPPEQQGGAWLAASRPDPLPHGNEPMVVAPGVIDSGRSFVGEELLCVPLMVLGRTLGALWLRRAPGEPAFTSADVHVAEEMGRRAGIAIDNARLFRQTEQALRSRDEFLSIASHELRTPVTSLRLAIQNLESMASEGTLAQAPAAVVARGLSTAVRQSQHLGRLIEELLDISRIQAGRFELALRDGIDLAQLSRTMVTRLERELGMANCPVTIDAPQPVVGRWDVGRLDQVLTNLLTNAMKFGAGRPIEITVRSGGGSAVLAVTDQGIGIEAEAQARIFDRFERGVSAQHYGGLGLGLYIVRQIVEAHRGTISVRSEVGRGSTFTVTLPR
jgi:PAS domain S-box-containing protein